MEYNKSAPKGMRDILPNDMVQRERILAIIKSAYSKYGFMQIETPCVEDINLLTSKQGGDNEKLIYKILKRGEKLDLNSSELCDLGLRYDLTVPLVRYYANNIGQLPTVFKAMQIGNVWRADRPQKGRFRQFVQCDIDIIGQESYLAEVELINATAYALRNIGINEFTVRLNDRRLLKAMAIYCGYDETQTDKVFIILDKIDKIGADGIKEELLTIGKKESCDKLMQLVDKVNSAGSSNGDKLSVVKQILGNNINDEILNWLNSIYSVCTAQCNIELDITLVRGMNYYTGTIFEISSPLFGSSIAGGGRYDELLGKLLGRKVCACGFSIGFERIVSQLNLAVNDAKEEKFAFIIDKNISTVQLSQLLTKVNEIRNTSACDILYKINNFNYQIQQLKEQGWTIYSVTDNGHRLIE